MCTASENNWAVPASQLAPPLSRALELPCAGQRLAARVCNRGTGFQPDANALQATSRWAWQPPTPVACRRSRLLAMVCWWDCLLMVLLRGTWRQQRRPSLVAQSLVSRAASGLRGCSAVGLWAATRSPAVAGCTQAAGDRERAEPMRPSKRCTNLQDPNVLLTVQMQVGAPMQPHAWRGRQSWEGVEGVRERRGRRHGPPAKLWSNRRSGLCRLLGQRGHEILGGHEGEGRGARGRGCREPSLAGPGPSCWPGRLRGPGYRRRLPRPSSACSSAATAHVRQLGAQEREGDNEVEAQQPLPAPDCMRPARIRARGPRGQPNL